MDRGWGGKKNIYKEIKMKEIRKKQYVRLRRDGRCLTGTGQKELHIVEESEFAVVTIHTEKRHPI